MKNPTYYQIGIKLAMYDASKLLRDLRIVSKGGEVPHTAQRALQWLTGHGEIPTTAIRGELAKPGGARGMMRTLLRKNIDDFSQTGTTPHHQALGVLQRDISRFRWGPGK